MKSTTRKLMLHAKKNRALSSERRGIKAKGMKETRKYLGRKFLVKRLMGE